MINFSDMSSCMNKLRFKRTMFFVLIAAFLSMQWSPAHIHLQEHHDHGGSHHLHDIEVHAHQSISDFDQSIDTSHDTSHNIIDFNLKIVKLDNECSTQNGKNLDDKPVAFTSVNANPGLVSLLHNIESIKYNDSKRRYIDFSTINLRAPPKLS